MKIKAAVGSLMTGLLVTGLIGCQGIGPNGPNTATGGFDPGTLFRMGKMVVGAEAEKRYGFNPVELMHGGAAAGAGGQESISFAEIGAVFAIYEAGKTNAPMKDLFQLLYSQKHPPLAAPVVPFAPK